MKPKIYKPHGEIQFFRTPSFSVVELLLVCIHMKGGSSLATLDKFSTGKNKVC